MAITPSSPPASRFDGRYSEPDATPIEWEVVRLALNDAEVFWISSVRPDGRPHVTPLIAVWQAEALYFTTGPDEEKAKNIAANPRCALTTGCNQLHGGLDVVVEGEAVRVQDDEVLAALAAAWETKYGAEWHFDVDDGVFTHEAGEAWVFEVAPTKVLAFGKGEYSQTAFDFRE
jgi:general stress protein 26